MSGEELTVEHGEPPQVLVGPQLLGGTQRYAQSQRLDLPLDDVDVTGIQEEDEPEGDDTGNDLTLLLWCPGVAHSLTYFLSVWSRPLSRTPSMRSLR